MNSSAERRWVVILGMMVAIGPMTIDMYLPSLPVLQQDFGVDAGAAQMTLSMYFLGLSLGQLFYGPVADRFGRRLPLLFGLALYTVASLICALAPSVEVLVACRFLQAIGGCAGMVIPRAMVRDRFEPQDMARVLSAMVLVMGVAPILAPLAGGQILVWAGWQAIFVALAVFGALCLAAAYLGLEETAQQRAVTLAPRHVIRNYMGLLRNREFMGYALAGGIASAGMFAYISGAAFVFIDVFALSPRVFAMVFGANAVGLIAVSQLNGFLLRRFRAERLLRAALLSFTGFGLLVIVTAATGWGGVWGVAIPLFVCISSLGCSFPNATAMAMAPCAHQAGLASALMGTMQFGVAAVAGGAVGQLYDGTAVPMAAVVASCGLLSLIMVYGLAPQRRVQPI